MTGSASRRGFLAALAAFTGGATATKGAVAVTAAVGSPAEPDAELLAAEKRLQLALAFLAEAEARHREAGLAEEAEVGPCPAALVVDHATDEGRLSGSRDAPLRWEAWHSSERPFQSWTEAALAAAISSASRVLGRGGRTPHVIRHLRDLLPAAKARDEAWILAEGRFGSDELHKAIPPAREAVKAAEELILSNPATTLAGAGVKARFAKHWLFDWRARSGYDLKQPDCMLAVLGAVLDITASGLEA